jgi:broad-specificity NMP kinase
MKKLILINGTMGIGKTTICRELNKKLNNSVWLDGDWCWMMNPFNVTEENKIMVIDNITYLLRNFLKNSSYEYVIFDWVMHQESIINDILKKLEDIQNFKTYMLTLICSKDELKKRILRDVNKGLRDIEVLNRSIERLSLYESMDTIKINTDISDIEEVVQKIMSIINDEKSYTDT